MNNLIIKCDNIFTSANDALFSGYIIVKNNKIESISTKKPEVKESDKYLDFTDNFVSAGFVDTHCFFTGWYLQQLTQNISDISDPNELVKLTQSNNEEVLIYSHNNHQIFDLEFLDYHFKNPVIIFDQYLESVVMNSLAYDKFKFDNTTCYSEGFWRLLEYILSLTIAKEYFKKYLSMMNSFGVTSIKEMGFDNYYGFTNILRELKDNMQLTARVHFMSQPVGQPMNLEYGKEMRSKYNDEYLAFSGFNQMTDGSISQSEGYLKQPYKNSNSICDKSIDWETLKNHTILADENDFRFSLHAQGDGAINKCLEIFNECKKDENGKLINRHSITDLEYSDSYDYKKMGELGVVAEIYPQIMSLYSQQEKLDTIDLKLGVDRRKDYWNRRDMVDNNVIVSCATDLPLLYDNIPNSIYHSVYNLFLDSNTPFNPQNALTITELLKAWTINGQYNLNRESILGSLEIGKLADITVLSENIFNTNPSNLKDVYVISTIFDGKIVYEKKSL